MAERSLPLEDQYPNNSDTAKERAQKRQAAETDRPKKVQKVTKGKVRQRKKPIGKKLAEAFGASEGQGVLEYILYDIIIPATKNMIVDSIIDGAEMAILGEVRGRTNRRSTRGPSRVSYDRVSYNSRDRRDDRRDYDDRRPRAHLRDYEDILFDTESDVDEVIGRMLDLIDVNGYVDMAQLYDLAGVKPDSPHLGNYGWYNIRDAYPKRVRDGYILILPKPTLL